MRRLLGRATVHKGLDGSRYMLIITSNSYEDEEGEWITTKALGKYVEECWEDSKFKESPLLFWHDGGDDEGNIDENLAIGWIVFAEMVGPFLVEIAQEHDSEYAQGHWNWIEMHPEELQGASHGFFPIIEIDGTYYRIDKFETSTLPLKWAANKFTFSFSGETNMFRERMEELRKRGLVGLWREAKGELEEADEELRRRGLRHKTKMHRHRKLVRAQRFGLRRLKAEDVEALVGAVEEVIAETLVPAVEDTAIEEIAAVVEEAGGDVEAVADSIEAAAESVAAAAAEMVAESVTEAVVDEVEAAVAETESKQALEPMDLATAIAERLAEYLDEIPDNLLEIVAQAVTDVLEAAEIIPSEEFGEAETMGMRKSLLSLASFNDSLVTTQEELVKDFEDVMAEIKGIGKSIKGIERVIKSRPKRASAGIDEDSDEDELIQRVKMRIDAGDAHEFYSGGS